jgi:hypothetical protein
VLVCQAYWRLRIIGRSFGDAGHTKIMAWIRQAAEHGPGQINTQGYSEEPTEDQEDSLLSGEELDGLPQDA